MHRGSRLFLLAAIGEQQASALLVWVLVAAGSGLAHLRLDAQQLFTLRQAWLVASGVGLLTLALDSALHLRALGQASLAVLSIPRQIATAVVVVSFGTFAVPALSSVFVAGFPHTEGVKVLAAGTAAALSAGVASYYLAARRLFRRSLAPLPRQNARIDFPMSQKIAALGLTLVVASFCILGTAAYTSIEQESERIARDLLHYRIDRILQRLRNAPAPAPEGWRNLLNDELALFPLIHVEVWDGAGTVSASVGPSARLRPDLNAGWSGHDRYEILTSTEIDLVRHRGDPVAIHARTLSGRSVRLVASLRVVDADDYNARALRWIGISAASLFALATVLSFLAAFAISRPILTLSENMRRFAAHPQSLDRDAPTGDDELAGLSVAFEEMALRIEKQTTLVSRAKLEWERTFDAIPGVLYLLDERGMVIRANLALPQLFRKRFSDLLGRPAAELGLPGDLAEQAEVRLLPAFPDLVFRYRGTPFPFEGERAVSLHFLENVTEAERLRQRAISAERQSAVGELVGRVAHEVRNPLFGISAAAKVLSDSFEDGTDLKPALEHIQREVRRLAALMEGLLELRRPTIRVRSSRAIEGVLREASASARLRHPERDVKIEMILDPQLPDIEIDELRIAQVIGNLLDNAILSAPRIVIHLSATASPEALLVEIADDGPGLSAEAKRRVFEPFFSTRVGGSGLGLRIAKQTMEEHDGRIELATSHLGGALLRLVFPLPSEISGEAAQT